ncbi:alcohol dehydrogenase zinc-binding domain-containing protein [Microthyrium microscopicum]|uniref:Alcohol dehydrogenase zinc-binding domain-containing protein n=1 Tax=Microthyrium microscopicum TaxID=703497 RepID=A0A6A6UL95_9PEZI|nr:alcohol dehydrogenase zinc-binding domain-containing protein [Microthyrium microscopicum]
MASFNIPKRIRAINQPDWQSTNLELIETDTPIAKPDSDEHLIRVYATAPCAGELLWAKNFPATLEGGKSGVPCYDLSGVVVTAPANSPFQPGSEVYTRTTAWRTGNAREYTIAVTSELALKPKNLSWEDAASIPLSAFTAYQALFEHGGFKAPWKDQAGATENGEKRLIVTAASGGVGVWVLQLAKAAGVKDIVAVVGPSNVEFVKELGASEVVNYKEQSLGHWIAAGNAKADVIFDAVGGQTLTDAWGAVKEGGKIVTIKEPAASRKPKTDPPKDVQDVFFIMEAEGWQLKEVAQLIEAGKAKPVVDSIFSMEDFQKAFDKVESGHARGKVMIKITSSA